jgi:hypothetical protein
VRHSILAALGAGNPPPPPAACLQAKIKASGKKASSKLKCWAKAAGEGSSVDPACLPKAESKFGLAFTKAEGKSGCAQMDDAGTAARASRSRSASVDRKTEQVLSPDHRPCAFHFLDTPA